MKKSVWPQRRGNLKDFFSCINKYPSKRYFTTDKKEALCNIPKKIKTIDFILSKAKCYKAKIDNDVIFISDYSKAKESCSVT